ncbi:aldehyde dehydrogenase (NAD+) [Scopulibacillus darangshiensis]|uniref:Aldehyde dehydrogenase (NAD+) n=2 Tax=Scopulibacillus darangshiensis TaxID=442528 RepID=A0A4R2NQ68_9BACL|nr:aldehyde dehydrogenase (NAD+) [Scopulibacillus darangshiensis]
MSQNYTINHVQSGNYINGEWVQGKGESFSVKNPSDLSETIGDVAFSTVDQVKDAEEAARGALNSWKNLTGSARGQYLYKMAAALEENLQTLATLASKEMGKPISEMKGEVTRGIQLLNYYASEGVRSEGDVIPSASEKVLQYTKKVPLGVVALITPWNFPVAIPIWKLAPALICGNTIIWKPAENNALISSKLCEVFEKAGLPNGVLNMVIGSGKEAGAYLTEKAKINGLSFTGSTATGSTIAAACAQRNIKFQTEMGGKNAAIVLNDADLKKSIPPIVSGAFRSAGQKCTATSRIIVEEGIYDQFIAELKEEMTDVKLGPALAEESYLGPVASKDQYEKVQGYVDLAHKEAEVIFENQDKIASDGYYIHPLIVTGIESDHPLFKEEIFGPVAVVIKVKNYDEAVALLNDTEYGLSASIFTNDLNKAHRFLDDADIGMVRVNLETAGVEYQAPFGGMKQSSSHTREQGQAALDFYTSTKTCAVHY